MKLVRHFATDSILHNHFSIMQIHAQNMQKSVLEKNRYADLSTEVHARLDLEQPGHSPGNNRTAAKKSWNNFLLEIFHFVLKLFQKVEYYSMLERDGWNIGILAASVEDGIEYSVIPQKSLDYSKAALQAN